MELSGEDQPAGCDNAALPLDGLKVLDLADDSGFLCGRILADLGADVVKVEPPAGDPARWLPPFAGDQPGRDRSLTWLAGNVNKRGVTCNLAVPGGRELLGRLIRSADVLVETLRPAERTDLAMGYESLAAGNPGLIVTSITPFGLDGPMAAYPASDLEIAAASGGLWLAGDPDRPPVRTTLPQSPGWSGMYAAAGTLMALLERDASGEGQVVDVSAQACMIAALSHAPAFWDILQEEQTRSGGFLTGRSVTGALFRNIWPCRDGYVTIALYGGPAGRHTAKQLVDWMAQRGETSPVLANFDWDSFDVATVTPETVHMLEGAIAPFLAGRTKAEFFEEVVRRNMLGYPVSDVQDICRDEQLAVRRFWQTVPVPWSEQPVEFPGGFALFDGVRPSIRRPSPAVGEHNAEVYGQELGMTAEQLEALRREGVL